jgi:radical SAM superfamily enzyme YgiQ (UPF0313 family)
MHKKNGIKITLINPPINPEAFVDYQNPLIGLAYMAAVLEKNGHKVSVIDCPPFNTTNEGLMKEITHIKPDIIGITTVTATFPSIIETAHIIKKSYPNVPIILGGPHATIMDKQILEEHTKIDIVIRHEGEKTIVELAHCISNYGLKGLHKVTGITFKKDGQVVRTPDRPLIQDLDELPYPAYKYFPLNKYRIFGKIILPVLTSRGCPYTCTFCMVPQLFGQRIRVRSPKNVVDELEWLRDTYRAGAFTFNDENFTHDKKRVIKICEEIKRRKVGIPWNCQTRVDHVTKKLLAKMREANCQLISFGVESGCQKILNSVSKQTTIEQNEKAVGWAKEAGMSVAISLIFGYPGETEDTLMQTLNFIRKVEPDDVFLYLATPYPNIELRNHIKDLGWKTSKEWSNYEMQTPAFENPLLSFKQINKIRETFYNNLYSPAYILRQLMKGTLYNKIMAETALHQLLWRMKLPWISANFKKLARI